MPLIYKVIMKNGGRLQMVEEIYAIMRKACSVDIWHTGSDQFYLGMGCDSYGNCRGA